MFSFMTFKKYLRSIVTVIFKKKKTLDPVDPDPQFYFALNKSP